MLFKQILLASALQVALTSAIDVDVNAKPGSRVDRFSQNHPKGNRINNHDHDHVNVDVNHPDHEGPTTVSGNVQTRGDNVDIDVQPTPGSHTDKFLNKHPKGNRFHDDSDSDDEDNVSIDVDHNGGPNNVNGNVQTRNVDVNVDTKEGSHTDRFLNNHPKGNRVHDDDSDSDDEDNVNVDVDHNGAPNNANGNVQTRNVDVNVDTKEGSHTDRFLKNHPKGNRVHNDDSDSDDEDNVNVNVDHKNGTVSADGSFQARNVDVNVDTKEGSRTDRFLDNHPKGNRVHDDDSDSDDEDNVAVNVDHKDGKTSVGGSVQTRNVDVNVDTKEGSHTDRFLNNHPKGNRFHDDSDSEDEDNVNVNVDHKNGTTQVGGSVQTRDVNVNVNTTEGSRTDQFLDNHPKGNRFHDDSDSDDEDNVDVNVDHKDGKTNVGGTVQAREYNRVNDFDTGVSVRARGENNVDVDVTPKPNSRLDRWVKNHPSGNRVPDHDVNADVDHTHEDGRTRVNGNIQTRGNGNAVIVNRCDYDVWVWSVDEGGSSDAIKLGARSRHTEPFRTPAAGGVVFKVSNSDQLKGGEHTQFEYAISDGQLYYDLSFVDCAQGESAENCPGHKDGLMIHSNEEACGKIDCAPGSYCPKQSYYVDQPLIKLGIEEPVYGCGSAGTGNDLYFVLCSNKPDVLKRSIAGRLNVEF